MSKRIILRPLFLLLTLLAGTARTAAQDRWDKVLDRYETICAQCIDLRQQIAAGDAVPSKHITTLLSELGTLRQTLQEASGSMNVAQRNRFHTIQQRYSEASGAALAVPSPPVRQETAKRNTNPIRQPAATPPAAETDAVRINDPLPEMTAPVSPGLSPPGRKATLKPRQTGTHPVVPLPAARPPALTVSLLGLYGHGMAGSYGMMAAAKAGAHWGGWIAARSNFTATQGSYDCTGDGRTANGRFWGNGVSRYGIWNISGGPLFQPLPWLGLYAGTGYSKEELDWQDAENQWARVRDYSYAGICGDAGLLFFWKHLALSAGCSWNRHTTVTIGLGVRF